MIDPARPPDVPRSRRSSWMSVVVGFLFLAIGLVITCLAVVGYVDARSFVDRSIQVEGRVVGYKDRVAKRQYAPVIEYSDSFGRPHSITGPFVQDRARFPLHSKIPVFMDPDRPERAVLRLTVSGPIGGGIGGIIGTLLGAMLVVRSLKTRR